MSGAPTRLAVCGSSLLPIIIAAICWRSSSATRPEPASRPLRRTVTASV